jgi:hypothetical protein
MAIAGITEHANHHLVRDRICSVVQQRASNSMMAAFYYRHSTSARPNRRDTASKMTYTGA